MKSIIIPWTVMRLFISEYSHAQALPPSTVEFRIDNAGVEIKGHFDEVDTNIEFHERNLEESRIIAKVKVASIKTGIPLRDRHLLKNDYFHAHQFPYVTLSSKAFRKIGRNQFLGTFTLELKNFRKDIVIPFEVIRNGNMRALTGKFKINRLDFDIGEESVILNNTVEVYVRAVLDSSYRHP